ncbi:MAG: hypothetical protein Tp1111DCM1112741_46 [Prokaryotic dsDNA virus sp.]|jgi:uncharacterized protein YoxC|nr:MAG: hypothetical protein Tp1111DCM1112741_46 [Prokaryotic dsDNA virus sp.]|tara:strand:- start:7833 stop:8150 length:318 start_codon:yes stop_codon:yes gene_type:complete
MEEMFNLYAEYGAVAIIVGLFVYLIMNLMASQKKQDESLEEIQQILAKMGTVIDNTQSITIKLVDRWNSEASDSTRRHEKMVSELNDVTDVLMELKGAMSRYGRN